MIDWLVWTVVAGCLLAGLLVVVLMVRDVQPSWATLAALAAIELALVVQLVVGIVLLGGAEPELEALTFVGYLIGILLVLPAGALWSLGEPTRSGTAVLLVALLVVPVLQLRLVQLWSVA